MSAVTAVWRSARGAISHKAPAGIMGIVNITEDSFYPDSRTPGQDAAVRRCLALAGSGADIVDLGAESSRPGSAPVSPEQELQRLEPVLRMLMGLPEPPVISVDTYHASTAQAALELGASIINDISACSFDPGLLDVLAQYKPGYVLMHCQGRPDTMQNNPRYTDVLSEVTAFFESAMDRLVKAGLPEDRIILDPGIGFGKRMEHNLALMAHPEAWAGLGRPSLMALSMKSVFNDLLDLPVERRGLPTQVAIALTFRTGYLWHRVHDAAATAQTLKLAAALA